MLARLRSLLVPLLALALALMVSVIVPAVSPSQVLSAAVAADSAATPSYSENFDEVPDQALVPGANPGVGWYFQQNASTSTAQIQDGRISLTGSKYDTLYYDGGSQWKDYVLEADYGQTSTAGWGGLLFNVQNGTRFQKVDLDPSGTAAINGYNNGWTDNTDGINVIHGLTPIQADQPMRFRVVVHGAVAIYSIAHYAADGTLGAFQEIMSIDNIPDGQQQGSIGVMVNSGPSVTAWLDNITVQPLADSQTSRSFSDTFDQADQTLAAGDNPDAGWYLQKNGSAGAASIQNGRISLTGNAYDTVYYDGGTTWQNYVLEADFTQTSTAGWTGLLFDVENGKQFEKADIDLTGAPALNGYKGTWTNNASGVNVLPAGSTAPLKPNQTVRFRVVVDGSAAIFSVASFDPDGNLGPFQPVMSINNIPLGQQHGSIGLMTDSGTTASATLDNITVRPLAAGDIPAPSFTDSFDQPDTTLAAGYNPGGWYFQKNASTAAATIAGGRLTLTGSGYDTIYYAGGAASTWKNYVVEADYAQTTSSGWGGLLFNVENGKEFQKADLDPTGTAAINGYNNGWTNDTDGINLIHGLAPLQANQPLRFRVVVDGPMAIYSIADYDDQGHLGPFRTVMSISNIPADQQQGSIGVMVNSGPSVTAWLDNITVRPLQDSDVPSTPVTDHAFYTYVPGPLSGGRESGNPASLQTNIRSATQAPLDHSWSSLTFHGDPDIQVSVAGYDQYGLPLGQSAWTSLNTPYTYVVPAGADAIRYTLSYLSGAPISPENRKQWVTISATSLPAPINAPAATSDPQFHTLTQGGLDPTDGTVQTTPSGVPDASQVRLAAPAAINPAWTRLRFTGAPGMKIDVFTYDAARALLASSGRRQMPFVYSLPATTADISYVVTAANNAPITPADRRTMVSIADAPQPSDPEFTGPYVSGGLNDSTGGAVADSTHFRLASPAYIDPSWKSLKFSGDPDLDIEVYAYDAKGRFLYQAVGGSVQQGERPLATPFIYPIPANTAAISYTIRYANGDNSGGPINFADRSSWVSVTVPSLDPSTDYTVEDQTISPEFTIPGPIAGDGGNFVNGDLWVTQYPSDDYHQSAGGRMNVYSIDYAHHTATLVHSFANNFGHVNSISYDARNNDLIFGNGSGDWLLPSQFYVINKDNIDLDGTDTLASADATTFDVPASIGWKINVIWTDQPNVAVIVADDTARFYKIQLATGTQHFDYGTYTAAANGQYNGTYKILDSYQMNNVYNFMNGAAWVQGKLIMPISEGDRAMAVVDLGEHNQINSYRVIRDPGSQVIWETPFYDPQTGYFGAVDAVTNQENGGTGAVFWKNTSWTFTRP